MGPNGCRRNISGRDRAPGSFGGPSRQNHSVRLRGHGADDEDSDIDLLVVEPSPANTRERSVEIRDAVGNIGYPVDVIVMRTERVERTKRVIGGIAYPANKYGRVIYAGA